MSGFGEAIFELSVGGNNVTERFNPILVHLEVQDHSGETTSKASVALSDVDGRILLPSIGDSLTIKLGWANAGLVQVFNGVIDDVTSRGSRNQGRTLTIEAHGFDTQGKAKEPLEFHKDKASLNDFMSEAAGKAELSFQAEGSIAGIQRDYWAAGTESFIHLGQRIAHEIGAVFKIQGNQAFMWPLNSPLYGVGGGDGSVKATWSANGNLLAWDISPIIARPRFGQSRVRYYDPKTATWKEVIQPITGNGDGANAELTHRQTRADEDEANDTSGANGAMSQREAGSGSVSIVGEPAAMPEGTCNVSGVRPGVDGSYRIDGVRHYLNRHSGFRTDLELKQPHGSAGADDRVAPVVPDENAGKAFVDSVVDNSAVGP